ncbi:transposase [Microcoleus vaginatus]|uniref:transposase n=1 Tax=Microcoleus vaginatus TaxID=119532 RepID=UPI0040408447
MYLTNDRKCTRQRQGCGGDAIGDQPAVKQGMNKGRYPSLRQMEKGCREIYRQRNIVELAINRLKQWSPIAIRYDKLAANYTAMITIACILSWL